MNEEYIMTNGEITTCSGLFMDSGGQNDYLSNLDYTFTIYGDPAMANTVLSVAFEEFSIEPHENCSYDYLKIYDGPNASSTLLGTFCGTNSPGTVVASNISNALTFVFHSDNSVVASGWKAMINCTIVDQVENLAKSNSLRISPNPVSDDLLTVEADEIIEHIELYSLTGQLVGQWDGEDKRQQLNLSQLENGIYLLSVTSKGGVYYQKVQVQ